MKSSEDDIREKYTFEGAVRGKHHTAFAQRKRVIVLAPDVASVCPDARSEALRALIRERKRAVPKDSEH